MEVQEGLIGKHVATEREPRWTCSVSRSRGGGGGFMIKVPRERPGRKMEPSFTRCWDN